jgi:hypothetical protein
MLCRNLGEGGMSYSITPNLGLKRPTPGADDDQWGTHWNENATILDTAFGSASVVNVLDHGAKGDGVTDDTAAIQAALGQHLRAMIYIPVSPSGQPYLIGAPGLNIYGQTTVVIDGNLKLANGANGGVLHIPAGSSQISIGGQGTIDANGANQTTVPGFALYADQSSHIRISGITLQNALNWNLNIVQCSNVRVDGVKMLNCGNSNEFAQGSDDCWLTNCLIDGVNDLGFAFYGAVTNSGAIGNTIRNIGFAVGFATPTTALNAIGAFSDADQPGGCKNIVISDNIISNCSGGAVYSDVFSGPNNESILVSGNISRGNGKWSGIQTLSDFGCDHCVDVTFIGNLSYNFGSATITARGLYASSNARGVNFTGNQVVNVGQGTTTGVGLYVNSTNLLFAGSNYFYDEPDDPTPNSMAFCISGSAGLRNAYVGNFCDTAPVNITFQPDTAFSNAIKGVLSMRNLPTASTGLTAGDVWRNGTVLNSV